MRRKSLRTLTLSPYVHVPKLHTGPADIFGLVDDDDEHGPCDRFECQDGRE